MQVYSTPITPPPTTIMSGSRILIMLPIQADSISAVSSRIISAAGYVPFRRLDRSEIAKTFGSGGGKGTRAVASYDEDTTTMAVEAARLARRSAPDTTLSTVWFSTANPAYLDKNNASAIHSALRLDTSVSALDFGGALRSGVGALRAALDGNGCVLALSSDMRDGLATSADEAGVSRPSAGYAAPGGSSTGQPGTALPSPLKA